VQWTENHLADRFVREDDSTSSSKQAMEVISAPAMPAQKIILPTKVRLLMTWQQALLSLTKEIGS